jgi:hypothetical protein
MHVLTYLSSQTCYPLFQPFFRSFEGYFIFSFKFLPYTHSFMLIMLIGYFSQQLG